MPARDLQSAVDNYVSRLRCLSNLIEPQDTPLCEDDNIASIVEPLLDNKLKEVQAFIDDLEKKCLSIIEVIATRCEIIGEKPRILTAAPPFRPLIEELKRELVEVDQKISDRERARAELTSKIFAIATELGIFSPKLPSTLTDEAFNTHHTELDNLVKERQRRIEYTKKLTDDLIAYESYLGFELSTNHNKLDDQSIDQLEKQRSLILQKCENRKSMIEDLEGKLIHLSKVLHIDADLPPVINGAGSDQRLALLKAQLQEFQALRKQNLGRFVDELRDQLPPIWNALSLDIKLRKDYKDEPLSEELCTQLEEEIHNLNLLFEDQERSAVLSQIQKLKVVYQREADLQYLQEHSNDISAVIKNLKGGKLRDFIEEHKPLVLQNIRRAYHQWSLKHPNEHIYFERPETKLSGDTSVNSKYLDVTTELSSLLTEVSKKELPRKVSLSGLKRPRPASSSGVISTSTKRTRPLLSQNQVRMAVSTPVLRKPYANSNVRPTNDSSQNIVSRRRPGANRNPISRPATKPQSNRNPSGNSVASAAAVAAVNASRHPKPVLPTNHSTGIVNQVAARSTIPVFGRPNSRPNMIFQAQNPLNSQARLRASPSRQVFHSRYPLLPLRNPNNQTGTAAEPVSKHDKPPLNRRSTVNHSIEDSYFLSLPSPGMNSFFDHSTD